ncbi:flavin reductase family protein [Cryobacterium arcticum]|uniref:Flavin reductase n=1 Tax=Cryobacterium arcticum TaxID=670052 RepID=A0A317ZW15_9MICO|nr:flavin reductase family protein [Cryobacterium arcticum]PXA68367.1 flavin reductase [Cryobacterium arcticum]
MQKTDPRSADTDAPASVPTDSTTEHISDATAFDPAELRRALAGMATSVTLVTTNVAGTAYGFTANSFTSVSVSPPLVAVFLAETAESYPAFARTDHVAINVLAADQGDVARHFATKGIDKFSAVTLHGDYDHVPVVTGAQASILGQVHERWTVGDHLMIIVHVDDVIRSERTPLVYQNREFRKLV